MHQIEFATSNEYKKNFANGILRPLGWSCIFMARMPLLVEPQDVPHEFETPQQYIASQKLKQLVPWLSSNAGHQAVVMDAGLSVQALNGFPGIITKGVFHLVSDELFLDMMETLKDRSATISQTVGWTNGTEFKYFTSSAKGYIVCRNDLVGTAQYNWNRIFREETTQKTMANMTEIEKQAVWGACWKELVEWLNRVHNVKYK